MTPLEACSIVVRAISDYPLDKVVVYDVETTGLDSWNGDEVLSVGICDGFGNNLFSSYVRPARVREWPEAEAINGISPRMVSDAPTLRELTPTLRRCLLGDRLLVGYNLQFDNGFMSRGGVFEEYPWPCFDVMSEYATIHGSKRAKYGDRYQYSKLETCSKSYGWTFPAHDSAADAHATARCFRALMCDEKYLKGAIKKKLETVRNVSTSQTKATTEAVKECVRSGMTSSVRAELRLGEITRGKNKGAPRYECFVEDRCVGVTGNSAIDSVRKIFVLSDDDKLPKKVACKALMSFSGDRARCSVEITAKGKFQEMVLELAKFAREGEGMQWREVEEPKPKKRHESHQQFSYYEQPNQRAQKKAAGCATTIAMSFVALLSVIIGLIVIL